jgi:GTPase involved in cell partitioning and DNA repair
MTLPNFSSILTAFTKAEQPLNRWLPEGQGEALGLRLHTKSVQNQPRIMVYGYYNAGKSTLLNALMGQAKAEMADRPLTAKVDEYEWNGYTLLDTPGIDAPIEHEDIANSELDNCDVVLFVLASGGAVEEAATWDAISKIIRRGRDLILIINNKTGLEAESKNYIALTEKLRTRLQEVTKNADIVHRVPIRLVNARTALKGRIENKLALVEYSGLLELEAELSSFLEGNKDRTSIIESCKKDLLDAIETAQQQLSEKTADPQAQQQRALDKARDSVEAEQLRLSCSLNDEIYRLRGVSKQKAVLMIRDVVEGGKSGVTDESKVDAAAGEIVTSFGERMEVLLKEELVETKINLREIGRKLSEESEWRTVNVRHNGFGDIDSNSSEESSVDGVSSALKDAFKKIPINNLEGMTEQGVKMALEKGKTWLPKLFKGIGPKTMGKWATAASRWAGPVVAAGTTIYDVYQVFRQEQEMKRQMERQTVAIEDAADKFVNDLCGAYRDQVRDVVVNIFTPVLSYLDEQTEVFESNDTAFKQDRQQLDLARTILLSQSY